VDKKRALHKGGEEKLRGEALATNAGKRDLAVPI